VPNEVPVVRGVEQPAAWVVGAVVTSARPTMATRVKIAAPRVLGRITALQVRRVAAQSSRFAGWRRTSVKLFP
jgi:hypothetical protein